MSKDYKKWSRIKSEINNERIPDYFHVTEGEIWWCSLGENIGIEIDGKGNDYLRPVLIIKVFNRNHVWVLPLTTKSFKNKFYIKIISFSEYSSVVISQLRTVSTLRLSRFVTKISGAEFLYINNKTINLLKYETPAKAGESLGHLRH